MKSLLLCDVDQICCRVRCELRIRSFGREKSKACGRRQSGFQRGQWRASHSNRFSTSMEHASLFNSARVIAFDVDLIASVLRDRQYRCRQKAVSNGRTCLRKSRYKYTLSATNAICISLPTAGQDGEIGYLWSRGEKGKR